MGYDYHDGEFMRIIYAMYLDVLVYYHKFKTVQGRVIDNEVAEQKPVRQKSATKRGRVTKMFKTKKPFNTMPYLQEMTGKVQ
ncbi:hypothetical protein Hanom_Chr14g01250351 [Helianthus anomalus]